MFFKSDFSFTYSWRLQLDNRKVPVVISIYGYHCELRNEIIDNENGLQSLGDDHMRDFTDDSVTGLTADNSVVKVFPSLVFERFTKIITLDLHKVQMETFVRTIKTCQHLTTVLLNQNKLTNIPSGIFQNCFWLEAISMNQN
jgi:hypothetical protein